MEGERCRYLQVGLTAALLYGTPAWALPTQTFQVNASIVAGCVVSGTTPTALGTLDFGTQPGVGSRTVNASYLQNSTFVLACTPGTTLNMSINGGSNYSGSSRNLKQTSNSDLVPYRLYSSSSYSAASLIPVNQNVAVTFTNANNITLPIYGQISLSGVYRAGSYADTLTVTLTW